ncbi:MAG: hypothetical protein ABL919_05505 [Methylococcales bacterium]|nr:hypothetical protein [Methylococcaceae bacterium]
MKILSISVFLTGLIGLYFVDSALKQNIFTEELFVHSLIRFVSGFVILGIGVFYSHAIRFKSSIYIVLALVLADDLLDYVRHVDSFSPELMLHSIYMLLWGALMGFVVMRQLKNNQ